MNSSLWIFAALVIWIVLAILFALKVTYVAGSTSEGAVMSDSKPPVLANVPLSKFPGEKRLDLWKRKCSLLDEEGNEEPTLPNFHSELPAEFQKEGDDE